MNFLQSINQTTNSAILYVTKRHTESEACYLLLIKYQHNSISSRENTRCAV